MKCRATAKATAPLDSFSHRLKGLRLTLCSSLEGFAHKNPERNVPSSKMSIYIYIYAQFCASQD